MNWLRWIPVLALAGCVPPPPSGPTVEEVETPNGSEGLAMECQSFIECYREAGQRCPEGYRVLDAQTGDVLAVSSETGTVRYKEDLQGPALETKSQRIEKGKVGRDMLIQCKEAKGHGGSYSIRQVCASTQDMTRCQNAGGACRSRGGHLVCVMPKKN